MDVLAQGIETTCEHQCNKPILLISMRLSHISSLTCQASTSMASLTECSDQINMVMSFAKAEQLRENVASISLATNPI